MKNLKSLSKFLSLILRHRPADFGLTLDDEGYAELNALDALVRSNYDGRFDLDDILTVAAGDEHGKKRFEITDGRMRAVFGHSRGAPEMAYPRVTPPDVLYHGTVKRWARQIMLEGLKPQSRQYVHLTTNVAEAEKVGRRHGSDFVLLTIRARDAASDGIDFFKADDERYLVKYLPAAYITDARRRG